MSDKNRERKCNKENYKKKQKKKRIIKQRRQAHAISRENRKYVRKKIEPYYNLMLDLFLKTFKNHSNMPKIKGIKYVKSYLGRCNTLNGEIEFSSRIAKYNIEIMRLVICHEFCHIFVPNHSKTFYLYLSKLCPDYKKLLKIEKENYQNIRYDYL